MAQKILGESVSHESIVQTPSRIYWFRFWLERTNTPKNFSKKNDNFSMKRGVKKKRPAWLSRFLG